MLPPHACTRENKVNPQPRFVATWRWYVRTYLVYRNEQTVDACRNVELREVGGGVQQC